MSISSEFLTPYFAFRASPDKAKEESESISMERLYQQLISWHLANDQQMIFLSGPRQVGKTTIGQSTQSMTDRFFYLNWDRTSHRQIIIQGVDAIAEFAGLSEPSEKTPIIVLDEIHKYAKWKNFLKGFYDTYKGSLHIIVTGSAKLDIYKRGSDSLMGRYFPYRVHPITVAECLKRPLNEDLIQPPTKISDELYNSLWEFGGFPEPFLKQNGRFHKRWLITRKERLFEEEIRTLTHIQEIKQMEVLAEIIKAQIGGLLNRHKLSKKIHVAATTASRWITVLENFYYIFTIQPWTKNVTRSLIKEPKLYLWDWSELEDPGQRSENFIASHLLKAVHYWQDAGFGSFRLYFIRDKEKREVDFLVVRDNKPWFLVEVKHQANQSISESLYRFQKQTQAPHAFQVIVDKPYVDIDCFSYSKPVIVPAKTLLSQLV